MSEFKVYPGMQDDDYGLYERLEAILVELRGIKTLLRPVNDKIREDYYNIEFPWKKDQTDRTDDMASLRLIQDILGLTEDHDALKLSSPKRSIPKKNSDHKGFDVT